MKTLLLIDGHAMIHRAFHALPADLSTKSGEPTGAVYGFFLMLLKVIGDFKPTHIVCAFDTPKPTFRKKLYKDYQAKRPLMDSVLAKQIPTIKKLLDAGGLNRLELAGFEADDIIGTLTKKYKSRFERILILTGDRDLLQLTDKNVFLIAPKRGVTNFNLFTPLEVEKKYGVKPINIPDYKALAGDSSDNYNTAKGIGPKTAAQLLSNSKTVEELLDNTDKVENPRWRQILTEFQDKILLFKKIATISTDVDIQTSEAEMEFPSFDKPLKQELGKLELFSLINKIYNNNNSIDAQTKPKVKKKKVETKQMDLFS